MDRSLDRDQDPCLSGRCRHDSGHRAAVTMPVCPLTMPRVRASRRYTWSSARVYTRSTARLSP